MEGVGRGLRGRKWEGPVGLKGIRMVAPERGDEKSSGRLTVVIQACACARVCACASARVRVCTCCAVSSSWFCSGREPQLENQQRPAGGDTETPRHLTDRQVSV